ncbi:hypothetical protein D3248_14290 [Leucobacter zeae]|nr:hypothetical protein [Leucobacter zeae]
MMQYLSLAIVGVIVGAFIWRAASRGRFAAASRRDAAFEIADTATALAVARAIVPWGGVGTWWWYALVLAFAAGVAVIALRWSGYVPAAPKRGIGRAGTAAHIAVLAAILAACAVAG